MALRLLETLDIVGKISRAFIFLGLDSASRAESAEFMVGVIKVARAPLGEPLVDRRDFHLFGDEKGPLYEAVLQFGDEGIVRLAPEKNRAE
jgi:hypothetical protein